MSSFRRLAASAFILVAPALSCGCSKTVTGAEAEADLEARIEAILSRSEIPSVTIAIVRDDQVAWEYSSGWANVEQQIPATSETLYRLASVTKLLTATAVMQLAEQDLLDIDADVGEYLPFPLRNPHYPDHVITTRLLLTHRSGLGGPSTGDIPAYDTVYAYDEAPPLSESLPRFLTPGGADYDPVIWKRFPAGYEKSYSNIGYGLLGYIVERISGAPCHEYFEDHILEPLGMRDTGVKYADMDASKLATLYQNGRTPVEPFSTYSFTAGGVWSSTHDMTHFMIAYMNGGVYQGRSILEASTIDEMLEEQFPGEITRLGWWGGNGWFGHSGGYIGHTTDLMVNTDARVGFVILSNGDDATVANGGEINNLISNYIREQY